MEKAGYLYSQYPFFNIYQNSLHADFVLESGTRWVAIKIDGESYHATGTGKTVTAVIDAKRCGGRVLFLAHTQELVNQAATTFRKLWPCATVGRYIEIILL